jgi:Immunity protein 10
VDCEKIWKKMTQTGYILDRRQNFEALVFASDENADTLEISRALEYDDQDIAYGMNMYSVVRSQRTYYGGVTDWGLEGLEFMIELDAEAARILELPTRTYITLDEPGAGLVQTHMARILAG